MSEVTFTLELRIQAPFLTHAAGTLSLGVDAATQRHRDLPVLNGSQLRGLLRHQLLHCVAELAHAETTPHKPLTQADIERWLGPGVGSEAHADRAILRFDLFWYPTRPPADVDHQPLRHRVQLAADGAVADGQLVVIESPYPVGSEIRFRGRIGARFQRPHDREACVHWLRKAVAMLPAVGALKGIGFGRVLGARIETAVLSPVPALPPDPPAWQEAERIGMTLRLDRPFHIGGNAGHQPEHNRAQGAARIPGAAIKAVMAARARPEAEQRFGDARPWFNQLVVTDALPAEPDAPGRPPPLPLSLALVDGDAGPQLVDLARQAEPCLVRAGGRWQAPRFQPDWKPTDLKAAEAQFHGRPGLEVPTLLGVRTAIDPTRGVADEGRLFALECTEADNHVWCADIDLGLIPPEQRDAARAFLRWLTDVGLAGIGKTAAEADVALHARAFAPRMPPRQPGADLTVLLRSPARLLPDDLAVGGINADVELRKHYADYWHRTSGGQLELGHYFAQQELVGGRFYQLHFAKSPGRYQPVWLTRAGSVFVLHRTKQADADAIGRCLADWAAHGLPSLGSQDWRRNPYLRENGFGEVAIDHHRQCALASPPTDIRPLGDSA